MIKVLVTGGRDFKDEIMVFSVLDELDMQCDIALVIEGGATGADTIARSWATSRLVTCQTFEADWGTYQGNAGRVRNCEMLREAKPDVVVAFAGGKGTCHMVTIAAGARVPVPVIKTWQPRALANYLKERNMKLSPLADVSGVPTFADYERIRTECGWEKDFGMVEQVWNGLDKNAKRHTVDQYRRMLKDKEGAREADRRKLNAERDLRGQNWGVF